MHIYAQLNAIPVGDDLINMYSDCCHHSTKTFWFKFSRDSSFSSYLIGTGTLLCGDKIAWAVRRFGRVKFS
jgi:hypothetical protein